MAKTITTLKDENGEVKGVSLVIVNTGGATAFQEMIRDVTVAANMIRRIKMGKSNATKQRVRKKKQEASRTLAEKIQIGRHLVNQE